MVRGIGIFDPFLTGTWFAVLEERERHRSRSGTGVCGPVESISCHHWHLIAFRRWKALASAAAAGLAGVAVSGLFFGVGAWTGLVSLDTRDLFLWRFYNLSLPAFLTHTYWRVVTVYNYPNAPTWMLVIAELGLV